MLDVSETAARAKNILENARDWLSTTVTPAGANNSRLKREVALAAYRHARLEEAINRPLSVGVYGASQAGKSYFVSALAKGRSDTVVASVGGKEVNFLTEINPPGGKESTGLVTRFTRQPVSAGSEYPIKVDLLTELDLVKIIANSFYNDIEQITEIDDDACTTKVQKDLQQSLEGHRSSFTAEDLVELSVYCDKHFASHKYYSLLKQVGYWSRMEQLIPIANEQERQKLFGLLWDNSPPYSRLFHYLADELARFAGAKAILCEPAALFDVNNGEWKRSRSSVINVQTLESLGRPDQKWILVVPANRPSMSPISVGVGALSALASEITVSIAHQPREFFSQADLLDFPGARSRHPVSRLTFEQAVDLPTEHFLRGKVAYLFERYCNSFGMTALLLCIGPSNQEVVGLNRLVEDWVSDAAGLRPDQRQGQPVNLFVVLTKFDAEFADDLGKSADESRWEARLTASLQKPFGEQQSARTNWLDRWDTESSFQNTYWWRSPAADQSNLITYAPNRAELAVRADRVAYVATLKRAYLSTDLVKRHFREPAEAWEAALELNDGGADYVMSNLERVCKPELRARQIKRQIVANLENVVNQLRPLYRGTDSQALQEEKLKSANAFMQVAASLLQNRRAGELLAALTINEHDASALLEEIRSEILWGDSSTNSRLDKVAINIDRELAQLLGLPAPAEPTSSLVNDTETVVRAFVGHWAFLVGKKLQDARSLEYFQIEPDFIANICSEVITAIERQDGIAYIAKEVERRSFRHDGSSSNWKSATIVAMLLNDFLTYTTFGTQRVRNVNRADGTSTTIFAEKPLRAVEHAELVLPEKAAPYSLKFLADWAVGFYDMIKQNAFLDLRDEQQIRENQRLGGLLKEASFIQVE